MRPVHPGEILREELDALELSAKAFATALDVPGNRITADSKRPARHHGGYRTASLALSRDHTGILVEPAEDVRTPRRRERGWQTYRTPGQTERHSCMRIKLTTRAGFSPLALSARARLPGTRHLTPETERVGSQETVVSRSEQVAADPEQIVDDALHRCEPLQVGDRLEPAHLPLALTSRLMRDLCAVVFLRPCTVDHGRHHGVVRR